MIENEKVLFPAICRRDGWFLREDSKKISDTLTHDSTFLCRYLKRRRALQRRKHFLLTTIIAFSLVAINENGTMGNTGSNSSNSDEEEVICLDCDKKNQKDLPSDDPVSQEGQPCGRIYEKVTICMNQNQGQISSCTEEWKLFQECHQQEKKRS